MARHTSRNYIQYITSCPTNTHIPFLRNEMRLWNNKIARYDRSLFLESLLRNTLLSHGQNIIYTIEVGRKS